MRVELEIDILEKDLPELEDLLMHISDKKKIYYYRVVNTWEHVQVEDEAPIEEGHTDDYDPAHAKEWMEKHPHGYYNNEHDYGEYCEDD